MVNTAKYNVIKKICSAMCIAASLIYTQSDVFASNTWRRIGNGFQGEAVTAVYYDDGLPLILAASRHGIYSTKNRSDDFHPAVLFLDSRYGVYQFFKYKNIFYAAADNGLWESCDNGEKWKRIFYRKSKDSVLPVYSVCADEKGLLISTDEGIYLKNNSDGIWQKRTDKFGRISVIKIISNGKYLYFSTGDELYRETRSGEGIKKVFQATFKDYMDTDETVSFWSERNIKDIAFDNDRLVVLAKTGIFYSQNNGDEWIRLSSQNSPPKDGEKIAFVSKNNPSHGDKALTGESSRLPAGPLTILASGSGVYILKESFWHSLLSGLSTNHIYDVVSCGENCLLAATDHGVFESEVFNSEKIDFGGERSTSDLPELGCCEPNIRTVQRMAISYADVSKNKIERWKKQARWKAAVPDVSVGLDRGGTDIYHWDTGQSPDVLMKGDEYLDWGVNLSWDFADIVWSTDQTTIDSRAKLMVELREDILDQVTRIYFERKRLMRTLRNGDFETDADLRVEELTALLDAFTGGEFSLQRECNL